MEKKAFVQLLDKYLTGIATAEEVLLLEEYYRRLNETSTLSLSVAEEEVVHKLMLKNIRSEIRRSPKVAPKRVVRRWWYAAAASIILLLSTGVYLLVQSHKKQFVAEAKHDVVPGSNKAILTLANGQKIMLDGTSSTKVDSRVMQLTAGTLTYKRNVGASIMNKVQYNKLSAPRGGQFHVCLSDGTNVWLNAASSISYPTAFVGKERRVFITGEAYFEVAKDAEHPFIVSTRHSEITVLGTHFNVMAYEKEPSVKTTLLEGSVKLTLPGTDAAIVIAPGQQASIADGEKDIVVKKVNTSAVVAWTQGYLFLQKSSVQEFMNQLSNWYDVDIEYKGKIPKGTFGGMINRNTNLSDVLAALAASGIHTKLEAQKIIVLPH